MSLDAEMVKLDAPIEHVVGQFVELKPKQGSRELMGLCPFHGDHNIGSFFVDPSKGLFNCFACGAQGDVFTFVQRIENLSSFDAAVTRVADLAGVNQETSRPSTIRAEPCSGGMIPRQGKIPGPRGPVVATYQYVDEHGEVLYEVDRHEPGSNGRSKDFLQYGIVAGKRVTSLVGIRRVLYRLPEILSADRIFIAEGEKCVHALESIGLTATTKSGGSSGPWLSEFTELFRGKKVVVLPDSDAPGKRYGGILRAELRPVASELTYVEMPTPYNDVADYLAGGHTKEELESLIASLRPKPSGLRTIAEIVEEYGIEDILDPGNRCPGVMSPWDGLNELTGGFRPGQLIYLGARPGVGKTTLLAQLAHFVAQKGIGVPYFSLEMNSPELLHRFLAYLAEIPLNRYIRDSKTPDERRRCQEALAKIYGLPLFIDDGTESTVATQVEEIQKKQADIHLGLVVIDYIGLMAGDKAENRNQEISKISRALKIAAKRLKLPFIVASQLGRVGEREGREPQLSDLRDSGSLEQDADIVMFLHRKDEQPGASVHPTKLIVAKQRQGPKGNIGLLFKGSSVRFTEECAA